MKRRLLGAALGLVLAAPLAAQEITQDPTRPQMLADADHAAWQAIGRINHAGVRDRGSCTGALVAPDLVLTAAHCVASPRGVLAPTKLNFVAGWLKGEYAAHRTGAEILLAGGGNTPAPGLSGDTALIRLETPIPADQIAPLPLIAFARSEPPFTLLAYRRDRPHALSHQPDCHPLGRDGALLLLSCPVVGGTSGAPVLTRVNGQWHITAVMAARTNQGTVRSIAVFPGAALRAAIAEAN